MDKPKTNRDAFKLVLETVGSKTALANGLGVTKQLTSRWTEIPVWHLEATCKLTESTPDFILPELDEKVSDILYNWRDHHDEPALVLFNLIRVILQPKANPWQSRRKPRKSRK